MKVLDLLQTLQFEKFSSQIIKKFCKIKNTVSQVRAELSENWYPRCQFSHLKVWFWVILQAKKIKNCIFLSTLGSIATDFGPVIDNICKIALLDTNCGLHFGIWVQGKSAFQISNLISMINIFDFIAVLITLKQRFCYKRSFS